jgi:hypothetical protein
MGFDTEPTGYEKTILSDLQGAWQCLRRELAENPGFDGWERALLHTDEAMSWESVRNLRQMQRTLLLGPPAVDADPKSEPAARGP